MKSLHKLSYTITFIAVSILSGDVVASPQLELITWHTVDGTYFAEKSPGDDLFWGSVDDTTGNLINPSGYSSFGRDVQGISFTSYTSGSQIVVPNVPDTSYVIDSFDFQIIWSCPFCTAPPAPEGGGPVVNASGTFELRTPPVIGTNSGVMDEGNQLGTSTFDTSDLTDPPKYFATTSVTFTLRNGQNLADFSEYYGADLIKHFQYILDSGVLPVDWVALQVQMWTWYIYEGNDTGFTGSSSVNMYHTPADIKVLKPSRIPTMSIFAAGLLFTSIVFLATFKRKRLS